MTESRELYFDRIASGYADKYDIEPQFIERRQVWNTVIAPYLAALKSHESTIFDIGCGNGNLSLPFAKDGFQVVGLDASENMVREAQSAAEAAQVSANTKYQAATLPLADELVWQFAGTADIILCSSVLEYVADVEAAITGLSALLKPGGVLFFSVPNRHSLFRILERCIQKTPLAKNTYLAHQHHQFSPPQCETLSQRNGLIWQSATLYALPFHRWLAPLVGTARPSILATLMLVVVQKPFVN